MITQKQAQTSSSSSSPSSSQSGWIHDVFISFRTQDTGKTFTSHLHHAFSQKGINTFVDHELRASGDQMSEPNLDAIEKSRISIIVFSKNYASSEFCLDEVSKIVEVMESNEKAMVWPVFYDVDPSEVRKQSGRFGVHLADHERNLGENSESLKRWRRALTTVANLSGWHLGNGHESKLIKKIVQEVLSQLNRTFLNVATYPVGLHFHLQEMNRWLSNASDEDRIIGIHGISGIGKTTIAIAVYNNFAGQFQGSSFLANIRDISRQPNGLIQLQQTLLFDILGDSTIKVDNTNRGINRIRSDIFRKRVLLVLDDVDQTAQLETLAGGYDRFGAGSRIIVTSRDEHFFVSNGVKRVYKVMELNHNNAIELFSWFAFRQPDPVEGYEELSKRAVNSTGGVPLALKGLGSKLYGRSISQWESALDKLEGTR